MYYPNEQKFIKLAKKGNVIPVYRNLPDDFGTPLAVFSAIDEGDFSYLLESAEGGEHMGRFSFLGSSPSFVLECEGKKITLRRGKKIKTYTARISPIDEVKRVMSQFHFVEIPGLPRFCGGLVGYMGYDMVRFIEKIPDKNPIDFKMPDMQFVLTDTILIFDHVDHKIKVVSNAVVNGSPSAAYKTALIKIDKIVEKLKKPAPPAEEKKLSRGKLPIESNFSKKEFCGIVKKAKEYIRAGEVIQLVLSQRLKRHTSSGAFSIFKALRSINPSPYMYYLKFGKYRIVGSSPEILVRCENGDVQLRPIAGTRPRGKNKRQDAKLEKELLADPKEKAEHIMLVDLGRNDIGKVCEYASVKVNRRMRVEKYSHVMHIVSDVIGRLSKGKDVYDLIRAVFPAGTVTGAPKVRAMELIDELENVRRGPYAGAVGYIGFSGNIDLCITIRTIVMKARAAYIQAGAGIVLDSEPKKEYQETLNKAMALIKAIEFAEKETA